MQFYISIFIHFSIQGQVRKQTEMFRLHEQRANVLIDWLHKYVHPLTNTERLCFKILIWLIIMVEGETFLHLQLDIQEVSRTYKMFLQLL